jgi:hypothetical protein
MIVVQYRRSFNDHRSMIVVVLVVVFAIPVVIFTIPVAVVQPPAFPVMIVVRMAPISTLVGRTLPTPRHPPVVMPIRGPIPFDPDVARARNRPTLLVAQRWWWRSDVHPDLCRSRDGESDSEQYSAHPIQFHSGFSRMLGSRVRNPFVELPPSPPRPPALFTSWYWYGPSLVSWNHRVRRKFWLRSLNLNDLE